MKKQLIKFLFSPRFDLLLVWGGLVIVISCWAKTL